MCIQTQKDHTHINDPVSHVRVWCMMLLKKTPACTIKKNPMKHSKSLQEQREYRHIKVINSNNLASELL